MAASRTFVFLSQVYVPDPAAVGQHIADAAEELARRGNRVIVYTANRGYDDPAAVYPSREQRNGVDVRRIPLSSFGKSSIAVRLVGGMLFVIQAVARSLFDRGVDSIVVSTSPPVATLGAVIIASVHRARLKYWVMDVNPDQIVALGMASQASVPVRVFDWMNRVVLRRATDIVVLDRLMARRINRKLDVSHKITTLPPWPAEEPEAIVPHADNPFRAAHGLGNRIVVMYSGNHGPSNPLTTILGAARRLQDEPRIVFMFIGGGVGKNEVDGAGLSNVLSLPYQPQSELRNSLSAADVHVVTVGDAIPGIVHPSKVYGAMAVGRPILLIGPAENHVADILASADIGWHVRHGDIDGTVRVLREILALAPQQLTEMGMRARAAIDAGGGRFGACSRLCDVLERGV
ncbi:MAG: glycosyltransferase family 4 protein [Gemmatimonadaceae bacterium]